MAVITAQKVSKLPTKKSGIANGVAGPGDTGPAGPSGTTVTTGAKPVPAPNSPNAGAGAGAGAGPIKAPTSGGGGGGAGAPSGGGPGTAGFINPNEGGKADVEDMIKTQFTNILNGKSGSMNDKTFAQMKQGMFEETRAQARASTQQALAMGALTGSFRSTALQKQIADIDRSSRADYAKGVREMMIEKAKTEFQERMQGLQMAQTWLDSRRNYELGKENIAATLESARIQAGATVAAAALHASATRDAARASAGAARAGVKENARQFDAEMAFKREQAAIDNAAREAAFAGSLLNG